MTSYYISLSYIIYNSRGGRGGRTRDEGQKITRQNSQRWNSIGKCNLRFIGNLQQNPLVKWQSFGKCHWKVKLCWKMPLKSHWKMQLKIHAAFWGLISGVQSFVPSDGTPSAGAPRRPLLRNARREKRVCMLILAPVPACVWQAVAGFMHLPMCFFRGAWVCCAHDAFSQDSQWFMVRVLLLFVWVSRPCSCKPESCCVRSVFKKPCLFLRPRPWLWDSTDK